MKFNLVLFDLDGTLMDTSAGIIYSYKTTLEHYNYSYSHITDFHSLIGGSIPENLNKIFHVKAEDIRPMVEFYRAIYEKEGMYQGIVYDGMKTVLVKLQETGSKLGVATLKREDFAVSMMKYFNLDQFFDCICGMDTEDTKTKSDIINECLGKFDISCRDTVMIGDTTGDEEAAFQCGVEFIPVIYGFGFREIITFSRPVVGIANVPEDIITLCNLEAIKEGGII